jgi:hypothetical protein
MRQVWLSEVRYYKYMLGLCIFLLFCGCVLFNEYNVQHQNGGKIINIIFIKNISYIVPIYKVQQNDIIMNVYDECVISNITQCKYVNTDRFLHAQIYYHQVNGINIVFQPPNFTLYFSAFAFSFSIMMSIIIFYAYFDFYRLRRKEYKMWSKQKKYDLDMICEDPTSFLYY